MFASVTSDAVHLDLAPRRDRSPGRRPGSGRSGARRGGEGPSRCAPSAPADRRASPRSRLPPLRAHAYGRIAAPAREHDHRELRVVTPGGPLGAPDLAKDVEARGVGQPEVEQEEVWAPVVALAKRVGRGRCRDRVVAVRTSGCRRGARGSPRRLRRQRRRRAGPPGEGWADGIGWSSPCHRQPRERPRAPPSPGPAHPARSTSRVQTLFQLEDRSAGPRPRA